GDEGDSHVVAEAIFAGKDKETFTGDENARSLAATQAIVAQVAQDLFVGHRPAHAGNGNCQDQQPGDLQTDRHLFLDSGGSRRLVHGFSYPEARCCSATSPIAVCWEMMKRHGRTICWRGLSPPPPRE